MPAFVDTQISDADLAALAAYFNSLPKNPTPAAWRYTADASFPHGQQVFHDVGCAQCHGPTFDMPRATLGGLNADFALFKELVYTHTARMREVDETLAAGNPAPAGGGGGGPGGPGGGNRQPPPLRMGNFSPSRVSESQVKEIYDWAHGEIGFRPMVQGRLTAGVPVASGVTYTLNLVNGGLKGKGLTATGMTVNLVIPAGATVVSTTDDGYKGVHMDAQAKANVAEWQLASLAPKDTRSVTITLSKAGTTADNVKGTIRWAKPAPKKGPNLDVQNIGPAPIAGG